MTVLVGKVEVGNWGSYNKFGGGQLQESTLKSVRILFIRIEILSTLGLSVVSVTYTYNLSEAESENLEGF